MEPRSKPIRVTSQEFRAMLAGRKSAPALRAHRTWPEPPGVAPAASHRVVLPFLPPSVNKLFSTVRDRHTGSLKRVLTAEARRVRRLILALVHGSADATRLYELEINVRMRAFNADGSVRKVDLTNRVKFLEDCICTALGIDDSRVFRVLLHKFHSDEEQTVITLRPLAQEDRGTEAA